MIIGLDLETTGLTAGEDRVIEICMGLYNEGTLLKNVTMRFNPCRPINPAAEAVHHISIDQLLDKPKFEEKALLISQLLQKAELVVIHNAAFDAPFLKAEFERCGVQCPTVPVYDTMKESTWATPTGKWPKLGQLCFALNVDYNASEAHSAEYDVNKMMECYINLTAQGLNSNRTKSFNLIEGFKRRR